MRGVPADELIPRFGQRVASQGEAAARQFERHVLAVDDFQAMAAPEVQESFAADEFLARNGALQALLLGQLGVDPEALFQDELAEQGGVGIGRCVSSPVK